MSLFQALLVRFTEFELSHGECTDDKGCDSAGGGSDESTIFLNARLVVPTASLGSVLMAATKEFASSILQRMSFLRAGRDLFTSLAKDFQSLAQSDDAKGANHSAEGSAW